MSEIYPETPLAVPPTLSNLVVMEFVEPRS